MKMDDETREKLGILVRETWVEYCKEVGDNKPSHIAPWEDLPEGMQEVDMRIGEAVANRVARALLPERVLDLATLML